IVLDVADGGPRIAVVQPHMALDRRLAIDRRPAIDRALRLECLLRIRRLLLARLNAALGALGPAVALVLALALARRRSLLARRLAVFARLVAIFLGGLVVVRPMGTFGKRRGCRGTGQQKRDQEFTHDSDLSRTLRRLL